jgi:hypothetical protein
MEPQDKEALDRAIILLENHSFAQKLTSALGAPLAKAAALLPNTWNEKVQVATQTALTKALSVALWSLSRTTAPSGGGETGAAPSESSSEGWHKVLSGVSGAVGGAFGFGALAIELPVSLVLMMRTIADIARSEGESLAQPGTKLACLEVLALGDVGPMDDLRKGTYYAARMAMAGAVTEAAKYIAEKGLIEEGAPALVRLVTKVSARLSLQVSEKAAAQAIPLIGAAGGAAVNLLFIDHFQDMARGHFIVRRLERKYGPEAVRQHFEQRTPTLLGS